MTINYIVRTQGWLGLKITECETAEQAWEALGNCSIGALTEVTSPTGKCCDEFIPF
jgi:hypothetical protein